MNNKNQIQQDDLIERNILSILLYDNNTIPDVLGYLKEEYFQFKHHKEIYNLICEIYATNQFVDPLSLKEKIAFKKINISGDYINQIVDDMPAFNNLNNYVKYLENKYKLNKFIDTIKETFDEVESISYEDLPKKLDGLLTTLSVYQDSLQSNSPVKSIKDIQKSLLISLEEGMIDPSKNKSINTGFNSVDELIGGMFPGDLIIIAGRPAMGKTAFACNIAYNCAQKNIANNSDGNILIYSLEMTCQQLLARFLNINGMMNNSLMRSSKITSANYNYIDRELEKISNLPVYVDDNGNHTIASIKAASKKFAATNKLDLIVVDYLQLINGSKSNSNTNRVQELSEISRGLKSLAKELNCPIIALSQLSRSVESRDVKRPFMSDLRDSGSIEQDADMVLLLYREEYYLNNLNLPQHDKKYEEMRFRKESVKGVAEVIVAKNRFGQTGTAKLEFEPTFTRFRNY